MSIVIPPQCIILINGGFDTQGLLCNHTAWQQALDAGDKPTVVGLSDGIAVEVWANYAPDAKAWLWVKLTETGPDLYGGYKYTGTLSLIWPHMIDSA